jgi:stage V sporulation protein AB
MTFIKYLLLIFIGLGSGFVISGAVFAFIASIGVVPRLAKRTRTEKYCVIYEETIAFGGLSGALLNFLPLRFNFKWYYFLPLWFCNGIFIGCLAVCLAEVMDVVPIMARRVRLKTGIRLFVLALAVGKIVGAITYFLVPEFYGG